MKNLSKEIENAQTTLDLLKSKERPNAKTLRLIGLAEKKIASMQKELDALPVDVLMLNAGNVNAPKKGLSDAALDAINALNISDSIKVNADKKTIFKKEFNDKSSRTKCRTKFLNSISLYLLFLGRANDVKAAEHLKDVHETAIKYYNAEDSFSKMEDYCSNTMDENKRNLIKTFIAVHAELIAE